jgi:hypothetical protein
MNIDITDKLTSQYWIRFELGLGTLDGEAYFNEIMRRSQNISRYLFSKTDEVYFIYRIIYLKQYSKHERLGLSRYFKSKLTFNHRTIPYEYDEKDSEFITSEYWVKVRFDQIRMDYLLTALANKDFMIKPRVRGNV